MKKVMLYIGYKFLSFINWILKGLIQFFEKPHLLNDSTKVKVEQVEKIDLSQFEIVSELDQFSCNECYFHNHYTHCNHPDRFTGEKNASIYCYTNHTIYVKK